MDARRRRTGEIPRPTLDDTVDGLIDPHERSRDSSRRANSYKDRHLRSTRATLGTVVFLSLLVVFVVHRHRHLPSAAPRDVSLKIFSEERGRKDLGAICSFGIRTVGSDANEVYTRDYLLKVIGELEAPAREAGWAFEVDVQKPSGAFGLGFLGFQNVYSNITNIVVRIGRTSFDANPDEPALLLSSHFDAAIGAQAASDDAINIAIMLEILRTLSHSEPTRYPVVFNFNGGEETLLQAAHGFITQHAWGGRIRAFINLEAAGAGGRELLFQASSNALASAYVRGAPYPHGSVVCQEIFQSGVIPSDTDFRVYRDYGELPGIDMAFVDNGYVYHTLLDDVARIPSGCMQRAGENVWGMVQILANEEGNLPSISLNEEDKAIIYFDFLGYFMVSYSHFKGIGINLCLVLASLLFLLASVSARSPHLPSFSAAEKRSLYTERNGPGPAASAPYVDSSFGYVFGARPAANMYTDPYTSALENWGPAFAWWPDPALPLRQVLWAFVAVFVAAVLGLVFALVPAVVLAAAHPMAWFARPFVGVLVFGAAAAFAIVSLHVELRKRQFLEHLPPLLRERILFCGSLILWTLVTLGLVLRNLGSAYLAAVWILGPLLGRALYCLLLNVPGVRAEVALALSLSVGQILPFCLSTPLLVLLLDFFAPLMGRLGCHVPSDLIIAGCVSVAVVVLSSYVGCLLYLIPSLHLRRFRRALLVFLCLAMGLALVSFPYSPDRPKRVFLQHVRRRFDVDGATGEMSSDGAHLADSGLWVLGFDYTGLEPLQRISYSSLFNVDSPEPPRIPEGWDIYNAMPWYMPVKRFVSQNMTWFFPADAPDTSKLTQIGESVEYDETTNQRKLHLTVTGPSHLSLYIDSHERNLTAWSLGSGDLDGVPDLVEGEDYFIFVAGGQNKTEVSLWLQSTGPQPLKIAFAGHYLEERTPLLHLALAGLPDWCTPVAWVSEWAAGRF